MSLISFMYVYIGVGYGARVFYSPRLKNAFKKEQKIANYVSIGVISILWPNFLAYEMLLFIQNKIEQ